MADRTRASIVIDAPKAKVMAVIADLAAYPDWAEGVKKVEVMDTGGDGRPSQAAFSVDAQVVKVDYTLAYDWDGDDRVTWHLVSGSMKRNDGSYTLAAKGDATEVTYELEVDLGLPMLGLFKRKAEKVLIDRALNGLKRRVEE